jgi:hypothetical protein
MTISPSSTKRSAGRARTPATTSGKYRARGWPDLDWSSTRSPSRNAGSRPTSARIATAGPRGFQRPRALTWEETGMRSEDPWKRRVLDVSSGKSARIHFRQKRRRQNPRIRIGFVPPPKARVMAGVCVDRRDDGACVGNYHERAPRPLRSASERLETPLRLLRPMPRLCGRTRPRLARANRETASRTSEAGS